MQAGHGDHKDVHRERKEENRHGKRRDFLPLRRIGQGGDFVDQLRRAGEQIPAIEPQRSVEIDAKRAERQCASGKKPSDAPPEAPADSEMQEVQGKTTQKHPGGGERGGQEQIEPTIDAVQAEFLFVNEIP